ncbi:MAG: CoA transferase [Natronomonas sp.]|uniref:CaiB/BaiF CoA transferase family protein n=1 Tax=Natronomonas sp. TaxID=2184060 RepID=UPI0028702BC9|nr:CoA transferase [Natronomonas sp.]MDR9432040.1 CoA transferase [Natronomonas sp.]
MTGALSDVRVVSFAQLAQGPFAAQIMGELGADVVKVEPPGGEWMRSAPERDADARIGLNTIWGDENLSFLSVNRNKRSIELNLKDDRHRKVADDLVASTDVLIENFRPGVMDRLGFGYEDVADRNPELVYCSSSGYGASGPYTDRPAQDILLQAMSGVMGITGHVEDPPTPVGTTVIDTYAAMQIVVSVLAALYERERTGEGTLIEVDMLSSAVHLLSQEVAVAANDGEAPTRSEVPGMGHVYLQAPYGVYETSDGHLVLSLSPVAEVADALDIEGVESITTLEEAYERKDEIKRRIETVLSGESTEHWLGRLLERDVWCAPVRDLAAVPDDPQVRANGMIQTIERSDLPDFEVVSLPFRVNGETPPARSRPPRAGEHTDEVLTELGYPADYLADR